MSLLLRRKRYVALPPPPPLVQLQVGVVLDVGVAPVTVGAFGGVISYAIDHGVEAILPLLAESIVELAGTLAETADPVAVIASV
jgi:hypothetical protein